MSKSVKKLLLVADYGKDDLAFKEVTARLYELAEAKGERITVDIVSVDAFNTAQTAAIVAKAAADGKYDLIYHNTAPRKDVKKARHNNDGEGLIFARYKGDAKETLIVGVNSGNAETINTSALLPAGRIPDGVSAIDCNTKGSQFRSRDVFPPHVIAALNGTIELKGPADIPPPANLALAEAAKGQADALLADAYASQLSRHGDHAQGHVTVIARKDNSDALLARAASRYEGAELDLLPLKSSQNQWIEAGFAAAQLALNSQQGGKRTIIALPGRDESAHAPHEAVLDNGAKIITSDLRALIFARDRIVESQSNFSLSELDAVAKLPAAITPAYTDGYGNVKLAITHKALLERLGYGEGEGKIAIGVGERGVTSIRVNGREEEAYVGNPNANGSFAVSDGEFALSSGSSGWAQKHGEGGKVFFAEIFRRGNPEGIGASEQLGQPQPGVAISIQRKPNQRDLPPATAVSGEGLEAELPANTKAVGA